MAHEAFSSDSFAAIREASERCRPDSIALLKDLIVAAEAGVNEIHDVLNTALQDAGCKTEVLEYAPRDVPLVEEFASRKLAADMPEQCLIGRVEGSGDKPGILLFAHPDTEVFSDTPGWQSEPFHPLECNGRLYGWGVADDLAGLAMLARSVAVLRAAGRESHCGITLISAPSKMHRRGISAALHRGVSADAAVYLHPAESGHGLDEIKAFAPGQLEFEILVTGRQPETREPAHTAFAHLAVNPFDKAMILAGALQQYDRARGARVSHQRLQDAIGRSANLMLTRCEFGVAEPLSRISETCRFAGAMTLIPGERLEDTMTEVENVISTACGTDPWLSTCPARITWLSGVSAAETPDDAQIYDLVSTVLRQHGADPRVNPLHTSSDIRNPIIQKAIPTVGIGPLCGGLTMSGNADEWVDLDDYIRSISATACVLAAWPGHTSQG